MGEETWWNIIGLLAAICTSAGFIPQLVKGMRTKRLDDVSPGLLVLLIVGCTLWFVYGVHKWDKIIVGANAFVVMLASTILYLRVYYIRQRSNRYVRGDARGHR
ncbi:MAG TPA: SemiSWEET family sugar transporter [Candidatus Hypogeohydataceae bacterium YC41]